MQLDDVGRAAGLVQPVDVLGDDAGEGTACLQRCDGAVPVVGLGAGDQRQPSWERAQ